MSAARTLSLFASTVLIAGAGLALAGQAGAATVYVAPGGSDANACSDPGAPWNDLLLGPCNRALHLENVSGTRFVVEGGNQNVTFNGGSWGGYRSGQDSAIGGDASIADAQTCGTGVNQPSRNILFDGV